MKLWPISKIITFVIGGFCFAVMCFLLSLAYIPELSPVAYSNFRRSGLIMAVPMIAGVGLLASIGWLLMEFGQDSSQENDED